MCYCVALVYVARPVNFAIALIMYDAFVYKPLTKYQNQSIKKINVEVLYIPYFTSNMTLDPAH